MTEDFDINAVTADVIESQLGGLLELVKSTTKSWSAAINLRIESAFKGYVKTIAERHSKARSFFHRSEPEYLYNFYVPIGIEARKRTIQRVDAAALFRVTPHVVIQGSGGCGKSVLTRHLLLDILRIKARIPVLIELRCLNQEWKELTVLVGDSLRLSGLDLTEEVVSSGIKGGYFALLFDGFDELNSEIRNKVAKEIRRFAEKGQKSWLLVTSRPDELFSGWNEFCVYNNLPLTIDQAVDLVNRTPIEDELKRRFIGDLRASLFQKHTSFLSNPLLLSIMLLTYQDAADIPKKLSVFYSQAYEALFQRHDAWKGGYKRQRKCDLDVHDFGRLFAALSLLAYDKRLFSFSSQEAVSMVKKACELCNLQVSPECYIDDCTQAVCLLVQDGLQITYSHRSFQEYFTARFIADSAPSIKGQLLERFAKHLGQDNVISLLHEIQPEFVEDTLLMPELEVFFRRIGLKAGKISRAAHLRFLKDEFDAIRVEKSIDIFGMHKPNGKSRTMPILRMAAMECSHLTGRTLVKTDTDNDRAFRARICAANSEMSFKLADATTSHPVISYLFECGALLGPDILSLAWQVVSRIKTRAKRSERSLDELLST